MHPKSQTLLEVHIKSMGAFVSHNLNCRCTSAAALFFYDNLLINSVL